MSSQPEAKVYDLKYWCLLLLEQAEAPFQFFDFYLESTEQTTVEVSAEEKVEGLS